MKPVALRQTDVRPAFLQDMAHALSRYGESCNDIDDGLAACAVSLDVPAEFSVDLVRDGRPLSVEVTLAARPRS